MSLVVVFFIACVFTDWVDLVGLGLVQLEQFCLVNGWSFGWVDLVRLGLG